MSRFTQADASAGRTWWSDAIGRYVRLQDIPLTELVAMESQAARGWPGRARSAPAVTQQLTQELARRRVGWGVKGGAAS